MPYTGSKLKFWIQAISTPALFQKLFYEKKKLKIFVHSMFLNNIFKKEEKLGGKSL